MYDIKKLKQLREESGVSFSLCKLALEQSNNDLAAAKKLLQKWGGQKLADKRGAKVEEGAIFSYVHHNKKIASLVELLCQTDFVAGNNDFQKLGQELAMQVASMPAADVEELLAQQYIRDPSIKVTDLIQQAVVRFGENIKINRFIRWTL